MTLLSHCITDINDFKFEWKLPKPDGNFIVVEEDSVKGTVENVCEINESFGCSYDPNNYSLTLKNLQKNSFGIGPVSCLESYPPPLKPDWKSYQEIYGMYSITGDRNKQRKACFFVTFFLVEAVLRYVY